MEITNDNFETEVMKSDVPVLLDFWAEWCGPCHMLSPIIEDVANDFSGKTKIGKINVDKEKKLASTFGVTNIPTMIVMKNGKIANTAIGFMPKSEIAKLIENEL